MQYKRLLALTKGLLTGDNTLPTDGDTLEGLLSYAFYQVAVKAQSMHLMTLHRKNGIIRLGEGDYLLRTPDIPEALTDDLDIDEELCYPTARYLASFVSKDKSTIHILEAERLINDYNGKVYEIMDAIKVNEKVLDESTIFPE